MKPLYIMLLLLTLTTSFAMGQEARYNLTPEYSPDVSSSSYEAIFPRSVYSPTNDEIFNRFESLGRSVTADNHVITPAERMSDLQSLYDSWLRLFIEGNTGNLDNSESMTDEVLSQLEWVVETDPVVEQDSPLRLTVRLRNASDHDVVIYDPYDPGDFFCISSIRLVKTDSPEPRVPLRKQAIFLYFVMSRAPYLDSVKSVTLAPGDTFALGAQGRAFGLNGHYDIFDPGEYELTFYTRQFCDENGKPAENEARPYPTPSTVRFKVIPKLPHDAKSEPLEYHYETHEDVNKEKSEPAPTRMPSNIEIAARYKAMADAENKKDSSKSVLLEMQEAYESCLDLLLEKKGMTNPAARTEKFAGLKWRALLPTVSKPGDPIILQLGLENISQSEYYNIIKNDAMSAPAVLASIRIHKNNDAGEWEEVPLTSSGAWLLYHLGPQPIRTVRFFSGGSLPPGMLRMTVQPGGAFGSRDFDLTKYWDLSQTGSYRLTFYTRRFLDKDGNPAEDQVRPFPESDTVYFGIMKY